MVKRKGGRKKEKLVTGLHLFKKEYWSNKRRNDNFKSMHEAAEVEKEAWRKLSEEEKSVYQRKAKEERDHRVGQSVKLHTRCSPKQFVEVAEYVRENEKLKAKAEKIGFGKILEVTCTKLHHELCQQLIRAIDPATGTICIRKPEWDQMTMPNEDMAQKRVDVVWWLMTHEKNEARHNMMKKNDIRKGGKKKT